MATGERIQGDHMIIMRRNLMMMMMVITTMMIRRMIKLISMIIDIKLMVLAMTMTI